MAFTHVCVVSDIDIGAKIDVAYENAERDFLTIAIGNECIHLRSDHAHIVAAAINSAANDIERLRKS